MLARGKEPRCGNVTCTKVQVDQSLRKSHSCIARAQKPFRCVVGMGILPETLARNSAMGDIQMKFASRTDKKCFSAPDGEDAGLKDPALHLNLG